MKMKRTLAVVGIAILFAGLVVTGCDDNPGGDDIQKAAVGNVLIWQTYGTGNNNDGAVSHSFIELYNISNKTVDLTGTSVQYANGTKAAANETTDCDWQKIDLSGTIPAGASFLIMLGNSGVAQNPDARLQLVDYDSDETEADVADIFFDYQETMDNTQEIDKNVRISNRAYKVVLLSNQTLLTSAVQNPFDTDGSGTKVAGYIDMVAGLNEDTNSDSGSADQILGCETKVQGTIEGSTIPDFKPGYLYSGARLSKQQSLRRISLTDTDVNGDDFKGTRYQGMDDDNLAAKRPRSTKDGKWNPLTIAYVPPEPIETGNGDDPDPVATTLLIWQAGGATDGALSHSFIELYNNGDAEVDLNTYSVQFADGTKVATNATEDLAWTKIDLTGKKIPAKSSFLILGNKGTTASPQLDITASDMTETFTLSNRAFKVVLMSNQTLLTVQNPFTDGTAGASVAGYVDMVGAINDSSDQIFGFETSIYWNEALTSNISKQASVRRTSLVDHDHNGFDFEKCAYNGAASDENTAMIELKRPKTVADGPWNPLTGEAIE